MMDTTSYFENRMKEALAGIRAGIGRNERPEPEVSPAKRQASFCRSCQIQAGFITQRSEKPMATQQAKSIGKTDYAPPPIEGDFCRIEGL